MAQTQMSDHVCTDIFGEKWSLVILRDILFKGKKHYREFLD